MKSFRILVVSLAVLAAPVFADPTVSVGGSLATSLAKTLSLSATGQALYKTQEAVHETVTVTTGVAIPHDYVHIVVGGADIPVDPPRYAR